MPVRIHTTRAGIGREVSQISQEDLGRNGKDLSESRRDSRGTQVADGPPNETSRFGNLVFKNQRSDETEEP